MTALAINESLATDYDGLLRIAPAMPGGWDAEGTVYLQHQSKIHVQVQAGTVSTAVIESGADHDMRVRNPWPGKDVQVVDGANPATVVVPTTQAATFTIRGQGRQVLHHPAAVGPAFGPGRRAALGHAGHRRPPPDGLHRADRPRRARATSRRRPARCPPARRWSRGIRRARRPVRDWSSYNRTGTFLRAPTLRHRRSDRQRRGAQRRQLPDGRPDEARLPARGDPRHRDQDHGRHDLSPDLGLEDRIGGDNDGLLVDLTPTGTLRVITSGQNVTVNPGPPDRPLDQPRPDHRLRRRAQRLRRRHARRRRHASPTPGINGCAAGATLRLGADQTGGQAITADVRPRGDLHHGADPGARRPLAVAGVRRAHRRGRHRSAARCHRSSPSPSARRRASAPSCPGVAATYTSASPPT